MNEYKAAEDCHDKLNKHSVYQYLCCKEDNKKCKRCTDDCQSGDDPNDDCDYGDSSCNSEKDCESGGDKIISKTSIIASPPSFTFSFDWTNSQNIITTYLDWFDNPEQQNCPVYDCQLGIETQDSNNACTSVFLCGLTRTEWHPADITIIPKVPQTTEFNYKCKNNNNVDKYAVVTFTVTVSQPTSCTDVFVEPSGNQAVYEFLLDGTTTPSMSIIGPFNQCPKCTSCSVQNFELSSSSTSIVSVTDISTPPSLNGANYNIVLNSGLANIVADYKFYVKATITSQTSSTNSFWYKLGGGAPKEYTFRVKCASSGSNAGAVNIGSYSPTSLTDNQAVAHSDIDGTDTTRFIAPSFTIANPSGCYNPPTLVTSHAVTLAGTDPNYFVVPTDLSVHTKYLFKLKWTFKGGFIQQSNDMSLDVGCSLITITQKPTDFVATQETNILIETSPSAAYTYPVPVLSPAVSYCQITKIEVVDAAKDSTPDPTAATVPVSASCPDPCYTVDLGTGTTSVLQVISFKIKVTITGGKTETSPLIKKTVICDSTSASITDNLSSTPTTIDIDHFATSPNNRFTWTPWTCSTPACCTGAHALVYQISEASNTHVAQPHTYGQTIFDAIQPNGLTELYVEALSSVTDIIQTRTFYVFAENNIGIFAFSGQVTLKIKCIQISTTITESIYPSSSFGPTDTQIVQTSDAGSQGTYFIIPTVTLTNPLCPIQNINVVMTNDVNLPHDSGVWQTPVFDNPNSFWIVRPASITTHQDYTFWIIWTAEGGSKVISTEKKMYVGCTTTMSFFRTDSFVNYTDFGIGASSVNIYNIVPPTSDRSYCLITKYELIEQYKTDDQGVENAGINWVSQNCAPSTLPTCLKVDVWSTMHIMYVNFKVRATWNNDNNLQWTSENVTIAANCELSNNIMVQTFQDENRTFWLNHTVDNKFFFEPFTCTYDPVCCKNITYTMTYQNSTANATVPAYSSMFGIVEYNSTAKANVTTYNQTYYSVVNTFTIGTYYVFIHAFNEYQTFVYSKNVSIIIDFPCINDTFWITSNSSKLDPDTQFDYEKTNGGFYALTFQEETDSLKSWSRNITTSFESLSPKGYCNISNYRIDKVLDSSDARVLPSLWQKLFTVTYDGLFIIKKFNIAYTNYKVFIAPFNGEVWGNFDDNDEAQYAVDVTFIPADFVIPNMPPFFENPLIPQIIMLNETQDPEDTLVYHLPKVLDSSINTTISVEVSNLPKFVTFDNKTMILTINYGRANGYGSYYPTFKLTDSFGMSKDVNLLISLQAPIIVKKPEIIIEQPKDDLLTPNISAEIISITPVGEMIIQFNASMQYGFNLSLLNSSVLDIYIKPAYDRHEEQDFKMSTLNLTWKATFYKDNILKIKMVFNNPVMISPLVKQDDIIVHFLQPELFYSPERQRNIHKLWWTLSKNIKKQVPDDETTASLKESAAQSQQTMKTMLIATFIMNLVMQGAMIYMMGMIRSLQLILHLPLMKVIVPSNVSMLFTLMIPVVMFDIMDSSWTTELFLTFDEDNEEELAKQIRPQITDLGYDSHNSILNLGSVAVFIAFYLLQVAFYIVVKLYSVIFDRAHALVVYMKEKLFFGFIIELLLESYLELVIAGYLNSKAPLFTADGDIAAAYVGYASLFFTCIVMPAICIYILRQPLNMYQEKLFKRRFGAFYELMRTDNKWRVAFYLIFMMRRIIFITIAFWFDEKVFQIQAVLILNTAMTIYQGQFAPMELRTKNKMEIFNEVCIHLASIHLVFFTDWTYDSELQYSYGWSMLGVIVICIIVNFSLILYVGFRQIYILMKGGYVRLQAKFQGKKPRPTYDEFVKSKIHIKSAGMLQFNPKANLKTQQMMVSGKSVPLDTMGSIKEEAVEETPRPENFENSFSNFFKGLSSLKKKLPEISEEQRQLEEQEKRQEIVQHQRDQYLTKDVTPRFPEPQNTFGLEFTHTVAAKLKEQNYIDNSKILPLNELIAKSQNAPPERAKFIIKEKAASMDPKKFAKIQARVETPPNRHEEQKQEQQEPKNEESKVGQALKNELREIVETTYNKNDQMGKIAERYIETMKEQNKLNYLQQMADSVPKDLSELRSIQQKRKEAFAKMKKKQQ